MTTATLASPADDFSFPPEMKKDEQAQARLKALVGPRQHHVADDGNWRAPAMAGGKSPARVQKQKSSSLPRPAGRSAGTVEVIFVGSALSDASTAIMDHKAPVHARHMRSIDDLLIHIENHDVDCAVVDQSRPTESRGLKLPLLASAGRVKHLIVLAEPKSCAEAQAIHGVHEVLRAPMAEKDVIDSVVTHACTVTAPGIHPQMTRLKAHTDKAEATAAPEAAAASNTSKKNTVCARRPQVQTRLKSLGERVSARLRLVRPEFAIPAGLAHLGVPRQNRWMAIALAPALALCLGFAAVVGYFSTSSNWSVPVELTGEQDLVKAAAARIEQLQSEQASLSTSLKAATSMLSAAKAEKQAAQRDLEQTLQAVNAELALQTRLITETRAHMLRLEGILAGAADGTNSSRPADIGLQSRHQLAVVTNEIAAKQIEAERIAARISYLKSIRQSAGQDTDQDAGQAKLRRVPSASSDLTLLAQAITSNQAKIADADKVIVQKMAEANNLRASLATAKASIDTVLATPGGRALSGPVTVLFVPDANTSSFASGSPVEECRLLLVMCREAGRTGNALSGKVQAMHPLFGKQTTGIYVETTLDAADAAGRALLLASPRA